MSASLLLTLALAPVAALATSLYAPIYAACPPEPLVRPAVGLSPAEASYRAARKTNADAALAAWLTTALPTLDLDGAKCSLPTLALAVSGGGFRSLLTGAGVIQALDARDSAAKTAGLYQALTYHAALSGGAWLLSALAAGDWPTVSALRDGVWAPQLAGGILDASSAATAAAFAQIAEDIQAKADRGFPVSLTEPWGRMAAYQIMAPLGGDGAAGTTLTHVASMANFSAHAVPFPIMTAALMDPAVGACEPPADGPIFEFTPFEFGSFAADVSAFMKIEWLGSPLTAGQPADAAQCATGFDTLAFAMGASSKLMQQYVCNASLGVTMADSFPPAILSLVEAYTPATTYGYSLIPNPFRGFVPSDKTRGAAPAHPAVRDAATLHLGDGGLPERLVPLLPLLEPARGVDAVLVSDNADDSPTNYPDGTALVAAYEASQAPGSRYRGRVPRVPAAGTFRADKAMFFGCREPDAVTVVYLPNAEWTAAANVSTLQLTFPAEQTAALIENGNHVATQGGDVWWAGCLACGLLVKSAGLDNLPYGCHACLDEYCWYPDRDA